MLKRPSLLLGLLAFGIAVAAPVAQAEVKTIRAVNCFPKGNAFSLRYEAFIAEVNSKAKGWTINYVGGAPAIGSPFTLIQNVAKGVFDMAHCTGSYYQNVLPEADALKMWEKTPAEIRKNGGWDYMDKLHNEKGLKLLARMEYGVKFHLYLRSEKPIKAADLSGMRIRVAPIYQNFFVALGASTLTSDLTQVYTYMENKTVDGYGWPVTGLLPDWHKVTGWRVDPGFYDADLELVMNFDAWQKLSAEQKQVIGEAALKYEELGVKEAAEKTQESLKKQTEQGIKAIALSGAERDKWLKIARDSGWNGIIKVSPTHGPVLKKYFATE
ncbi:MAG: TRAP transporter substrate-binding protein DctP [Alphaproteobacteria bacterium]